MIDRGSHCRQIRSLGSSLNSFTSPVTFIIFPSGFSSFCLCRSRRRRRRPFHFACALSSTSIELGANRIRIDIDLNNNCIKSTFTYYFGWFLLCICCSVGTAGPREARGRSAKRKESVDAEFNGKQKCTLFFFFARWGKTASTKRTMQKLIPCGLLAIPVA